MHKVATTSTKDDVNYRRRSSYEKLAGGLLRSGIVPQIFYFASAYWLRCEARLALLCCVVYFSARNGYICRRGSFGCAQRANLYMPSLGSGHAVGGFHYLGSLPSFRRGYLLPVCGYPCLMLTGLAVLEGRVTRAASDHVSPAMLQWLTLVLYTTSSLVADLPQLSPPWCHSLGPSRNGGVWPSSDAPRCILGGRRHGFHV